MGPVLYIIDIFIAAFLIIVILLQQGKGSDMGAAFGGSEPDRVRRSERKAIIPG